MAGLYIHIPFCRSRCIYCGFYSTTLLHLQDRYVDALCREMDMRPSAEVSTVYLGGGTPSQLSACNLERLFGHIQKNYPAVQTREGASAPRETTMECNPDDLTDEFCAVLRHLPVNRVSMGAQTFSDQRLKFLHRRHNAAQVDAAVARLRHVGIGNISIDLMFGFPGETLEDWLFDLDKAIALRPEHISAYSLMYEEGTELERLLTAGKTEMLGEDLSRQMYEMLLDRLAAAGYEHYEISNFARPGYRSRHNSSYWNLTPYIGIGAAAHSYDGQNVRSWNVADVNRYIESIERGVLASEHEVLDDVTRYNDLITTALRTREGIRLNTLNSHFRNYLLSSARRSLEAGLLTLRSTQTADGELEYISLTRRGLFVSDDVMSDLIFV
ncbi:MAG: radical SAM family heme chaperone HemW [Prevotella sp.]|nr:radical SAM family heme chaperone HemW [Prevotella sp.]